MAVINKDNPNMDFPLQISRQYGAPLDKTCIFYSESDMKEYIEHSPLAYVGQIISLVDEADASSTIYVINSLDGDYFPLADTYAVDDKIAQAITTALNTPV